MTETTTALIEATDEEVTENHRHFFAFEGRVFSAVDGEVPMDKVFGDINFTVRRQTGLDFYWEIVREGEKHAAERSWGTRMLDAGVLQVFTQPANASFTMYAPGGWLRLDVSCEGVEELLARLEPSEPA